MEREEEEVVGGGFQTWKGGTSVGGGPTCVERENLERGVFFGIVKLGIVGVFE